MHPGWAAGRQYERRRRSGDRSHDRNSAPGGRTWAYHITMHPESARELLTPIAKKARLTPAKWQNNAIDLVPIARGPLSRNIPPGHERYESTLDKVMCVEHNTTYRNASR